MQIRGVVRTIKTGNPVPDNTEVELRRHVDGSLIATVLTTGGMYEYFMNGSPGPYYVRVAIDEEVHISSSQVVGMSGPMDIGGLHLYFRLWRDGYIPNVMEQGSVFSSGAGMQVTVRSGVHLVRGVLYDQPGHVNLAIEPPDSQPRIDTVVIEVMRPGSGVDIEGRTRLVVKTGTPSSSPVAPGLTQTSDGLWEHPIADVTVDPGVSSVASNKVTDRRTAASAYFADGSVTNEKLAEPDPKSTAEVVSVLRAPVTGVVPEWGGITLKELSDVMENPPTNGQALVWDSAEAKWKPGTVSGGGGGSARGIEFNETNFTPRGVVGTATMGSASVTLGPGKWMLESWLTMTVRGRGGGSWTTITLDGNGAPSGSELSQRIFAASSGVYRQIVLSARRKVTITSQTKFTVNAKAAHQAGDWADLRDGVVMLRAFPS